MTQRKQALAAIYMILVLSIHPLEAKRVLQMNDAFKTYGEGQELMNELQTALHEETQSEKEEDEYIGEYFASCSRRKEDFERRAKKTNDRYDEAMEDGRIDLSEAAWVTLKARVMVKTLKKAEDQGCDWPKKKSAKTTDLDALLGKISSQNNCLPAAKAKLEAAGQKSEQEQADALKAAMAIMLSEGCTEDIPQKTEVKDGATIDSFETEIDEGADNLVEKAHDREAKELKEAKQMQHVQSLFIEGLEKKLSGKSLLEAEGFQTKELDELLAKPVHEQTADAALLEIFEKAQTQNPLAEFFAKIIGFIIIAILWALFCWVILALLMAVLGLIMCLIKMLIVAFLRLFGSEKWDWDFGGCMKFWLGALGHSGGGGDIGIAMCAASMMSGRR